MTIKRLTSGKWQVNIQPGGRAGKRVKKSFDTKSEALAWERHIRAKVQQQPDWAPVKKDSRRLSDLVDIWHKRHGVGLKDGAGRKRILESLVASLGNPLAADFNASAFAEYRAKRLEAGLSANTLNHEHAYLRAVFNEVRRLGEWSGENPLTDLRSFKIQERELTFLTSAQINKLLSKLEASTNPHVALVAKLCLATGARWSEAEGLRIGQLIGDAIQYTQTKSYRNRSVPISSALAGQLRHHYDSFGTGERLFASCYAAFRSSIAEEDLKLPAGQLTHVLRHSFASHFIMNGGNIVTLQRILGHQSLTMTMRYAHLSPDHLQAARQLNPLASAETSSTP